MRDTVRARLFAAIRESIQTLPVVDRVLIEDPDASVVVPEGKVVVQMMLGPDYQSTPEISIESLEVQLLVMVYLPSVAPGGVSDDEFAADVCGDLYVAVTNSPEIFGTLAVNVYAGVFCGGVGYDGTSKFTAQELTITYRFTTGDPTAVR